MTAPPRPARAVRLGPRSVAALVLVSAVGVMAFGWPLLADSASGLAHSQDAPWLFAALLPLLLAVAVATVTDTSPAGAGRPPGLDAKAIAMLGVLAAAGAALRPLGAGTAGIEPMFFLMVLAGRGVGPGFGFVLGSVAMFASALLTGGVGPWLPFQMLSMGWVSMGAGLLPGAMGVPPAHGGPPCAWGSPCSSEAENLGEKPRARGRMRGRRELALLAAYGALAAVLYGLVMNLQGWPYIAGLASGVSFVPGDPLHDNLARYLAYCLATSLGWDLPRALVTVVLTATLGGPVLKALRRATRRAAFEAPFSFAPGTPPEAGTTGAARPTTTAAE
ncbi:ECF transporter S component [Streptomyces sp. CT34]|uniref:ECF transporter S component n=1 Tax=Streptomyces sp. CT34 TaxID=1553907 RepID=UPI00068E97F7|nr:ECF transporter S component [Streptomyces sp. CT34]